MVDVPRFELGASSMPRKRASKLRHTPNKQATYEVHLRRMGDRKIQIQHGWRPRNTGKVA